MSIVDRKEPPPAADLISSLKRHAALDCTPTLFIAFVVPASFRRRSRSVHDGECQFPVWSVIFMAIQRVPKALRVKGPCLTHRRRAPSFGKTGPLDGQRSSGMRQWNARLGEIDRTPSDRQPWVTVGPPSAAAEAVRLDVLVGVRSWRC